MTEEEMREKIVELETNYNKIKDENETLSTKVETLENSIKEKDSKIVKLQESNMRFFEQITLKKEEKEENQNTSNISVEVKKIDDIIDLI